MDEASSLATGVTPTNADATDFDLDVTCASGKILAIGDAALLEMLAENLRGEHKLSIAHSDRALTDCSPVSFINRQTISQIEAESGIAHDKR